MKQVIQRGAIASILMTTPVYCDARPDLPAGMKGEMEITVQWPDEDTRPTAEPSGEVTP